MREVTTEEMFNLIQTAHGKPFVDTIDKLLPGFKRFVETDPAFQVVGHGRSELTAIMHMFGMVHEISTDTLITTKDIWSFAAIIGYYLRELEGEKVPSGVMVH